jgi:hypothetical protein
MEAMEGRAIIWMRLNPRNSQRTYPEVFFNNPIFKWGQYPAENKHDRRRGMSKGT